MKNFIIYDDTGSILRAGSCPDDLFSSQARDGENIIEGSVSDDANHKILNGQIVYQPAPVLTSEILDELRDQRDSRLQVTDWTQIPDAPLTETQKEQYRLYRQALRDLPSNYDTITNIAEVDFPRLEDY